MLRNLIAYLFFVVKMCREQVTSDDNNKKLSSGRRVSVRRNFRIRGPRCNSTPAERRHKDNAKPSRRASSLERKRRQNHTHCLRPGWTLAVGDGSSTLFPLDDSHACTRADVAAPTPPDRGSSTSTETFAAVLAAAWSVPGSKLWRRPGGGRKDRG
jgi:hypothetical protein